MNTSDTGWVSTDPKTREKLSKSLAKQVIQREVEADDVDDMLTSGKIVTKASSGRGAVRAVAKYLKKRGVTVAIASGSRVAVLAHTKIKVIDDGREWVEDTLAYLMYQCDAWGFKLIGTVTIGQHALARLSDRGHISKPNNLRKAANIALEHTLKAYVDGPKMSTFSVTFASGHSAIVRVSIHPDGAVHLAIRTLLEPGMHAPNPRLADMSAL